MLNLELGRFSLKDDGQIFWQENKTNPLPGVPVGTVSKGDTLFDPRVFQHSEFSSADVSAETLETAVTAWLGTHIKTVLEPLFALEIVYDDESREGLDAALEIGSRLKQALGLVPRSELQTLIDALTPEGRRFLRSRHVRLGPETVFLPKLGKPAAVRLRGLLWTLNAEKPLPAQVPADGIVSLTVAPETIDPAFYRAIGYPVYGPRAIRADMLDRVAGCVYDESTKGTFRAQHKMAEWLGCGIEDLYAVLEALGHKKIVEPVLETPSAEASPVSDQVAAEVEPKPDPAPAPVVKPELAQFRLRRAVSTSAPPKQKPAKSPPQAKPESKPRKADRKKSSPEPLPKKTAGTFAPLTMKVEDSPFAALKALTASSKSEK